MFDKIINELIEKNISISFAESCTGGALASTLTIVILMFLVAGITSCALVKMPIKDFFKSAFRNMLGVLPALVLILMASSIKAYPLW